MLLPVLPAVVFIPIEAGNVTQVDHLCILP
jgi:hypothetical protein